MTRYQYNITGVIQGVGFRPFIYKLATSLNLKGFVLNNSTGVQVELEGKQEDIMLFEERLVNEFPPLAKIDDYEKHHKELQGSQEFKIIQTQNKHTKITLISPDIKVCDDCIEDIKANGKYQNYFATNCTNCGPRYSIIKTLPYDRVNTSMSEFEMCDSCRKEYNDPTNRRYHAQPISCNDCGPKISLLDSHRNSVDTNDIYSEIAKQIKSSKIVAIKGVGGFHLVCDATNDEVVSRLRKEKNRPSKPFAIMCKDIDMISSFTTISKIEKDALLSNKAPILLLSIANNSRQILSQFVYPKINKVGCFLPYTPLHILLFEKLDIPLVATSANLGGEPVIISKEDIYKKLPFVDFVVDFNRDIQNAIDDSLIQFINDDRQILRSARGFTPTVFKLPKKIDKPILAVGANSKSTISIAFDDTIILSGHIGDLGNLKAFEYFTRTIASFKKFYDFEPELIVHDMHPNYETTKWAKKQKENQDKELLEVQHHLAHIYATKAQFNLEDKPYLGFSFDGTGYGQGGTLWGGEVFIDDNRTYSFKTIKLLGGTKAIKEPRRVALAMLFDKLSLDEVLNLDSETLKAFSELEIKLLHQSYTKNLNSFDTSSVGRLFDGIASFANLSQMISYAGESGLYIEANYDESINDSFEYSIEDGIIDIKIVEFVLNNSFDVKLLSTMLINTLHDIVLDISSKHNEDIILTGGVFQNKTLLKKVVDSLDKINRKYYLPSDVPLNDAGVSLGQIYYAIVNHIK